MVGFNPAISAGASLARAPLRGVAEKIEEIFPTQYLEMINPLIFTNLHDFGDEAFQSWLLRSNAPRSANVEGVALYRYSPGTLVDRDGSYVAYSSGVLIAEQMSPSQVASPQMLRDLLDRRDCAGSIRSECLLVARFGATTWGHWLCELLPKIVVAEKFYPKRFLYVVPSSITTRNYDVSEEYTASVLDSLDAYGVDQCRLIRLPNDRALSFDFLYDIDKVCSDGIHPQVVSTMQSSIKLSGCTHLPNRAAILRRAGESRSILNLTDLLDLVSHRGYHVIDIKSLPFVQQVALFSSADSLVASLGSGLAGSIYARVGLDVLTVAPSKWYDGYFINILSQKRAFHADIRGCSIRAAMDGEGLSPFFVELERVNEGLDALSARSACHNRGMVILGEKNFPRSLGRKVFETAFGSNANRSYCETGWCTPEENHTWSLGPASTLVLRDCILSYKPHWLELSGISFVEEVYLPFKPLGVVVNGHKLTNEIVAGDAHIFWYVPAKIIDLSGQLRLEFIHPICPSPLSFGVSTDARPLGFGFIRLAWYEMVES